MGKSMGSLWDKLWDTTLIYTETGQVTYELSFFDLGETFQQKKTAMT